MIKKTKSRKLTGERKAQALKNLRKAWAAKRAKTAKASRKAGKKTGKKSHKKSHKKAGKRRSTSLTTKKGTLRRRSKASWAKWASKQKRSNVMQGPMPPMAAKVAAEGMRARVTRKGRKRPMTHADMTRDYFKMVKRQASGKAPKATVTASSIIKGAAKAAKTRKIIEVGRMKAAWVCGNPQRKFTGCGGGKKKGRGARVLGHLLGD